MTVRLDHSSEEFVNSQVSSGRFPSAEAVVSAAMSLLMSDESEDGLAAEDAAAADAADREYAAGSYRPWREVSAALRQKYMGE